MPLDIIKTGTYLTIHLVVGFSVAYILTGSAALAGGIALIEPVVNAVAFFFHERAWQHVMAGPPRGAGREWMREQAHFA